MVEQKRTGRAMSMPGGLALGGCVSLGVTVLGAALLAKLVETETVAQESVGYGIMILLTAAAFLGATVSQVTIKRRRALVCLLSGGVYMGILLGITALFFGGQYSAVGVTSLMVLCGAGLALLRVPCASRKRRGRGRGYSR